MTVLATTDDQVSKFLATMKGRTVSGLPRLIFAVDATASRQPTWDLACHVQGQMFNEAARFGGIQVQLVYYRGMGECRASRWVGDAGALMEAMTDVRCRAGATQVAKVLRHTATEAGRGKVAALVFVGDCFEERLDDALLPAADLVAAGVKCFVFQEGVDPAASAAFRRIADLTGGALCAFDAASPGRLRSLLGAVAAYAAGGRPALEDLARRDPEVKLLARQVA